MREFDGFGAFAAHLADLAATAVEAERRGLEKACVIVETEAKHEIGTYQDAAGPFDAWAPLSDATLNGGIAPSGFRYPGKIELGYAPPDNPLLREGALRDAIEHDVDGQRGVVGVKSAMVSPPYGQPVDIGDVAIWQERGTINMPARSFLGGAAVRKTNEAVDAIGAEIVGHITGGMLP